jgi:hypothetical protein
MGHICSLQSGAWNVWRPQNRQCRFSADIADGLICTTAVRHHKTDGQRSVKFPLLRSSHLYPWRSGCQSIRLFFRTRFYRNSFRYSQIIGLRSDQGQYIKSYLNYAKSPLTRPLQAVLAGPADKTQQPESRDACYH